jgi:hypothetical protein
MQAKVTFKGNVREISIDFQVNKDNFVEYNLSINPEIALEDDVSELETRLAYFFLSNLQQIILDNKD